MRKGMHVAFGSIALGLLVALEAPGQFGAPPQPVEGQPAPPQQAQPGPAQAQPAPQRDLVATVNGDPITRADLQGQVQTVLQARRQQEGEQARQPSPQEMQQIQQDVLNNLIEGRLVEQYVRQQGPDVKAEEIDKVLDGLRQNLKAQGVTLEQYLAVNKQTVEELRKRLEGSLAWRKLQQEEMSPEKLREFYEDQRQRFGQASFEQVQPQVTQLYANKIWNDIVQQMRPEAKIEVAGSQAAQPQMPAPQPPQLPRQ
jgi:hypothetical protein